MKLQKENIHRLGIYFFYDKNGIVDRFVSYLLADLRKSLDRLIVVCNGSLNENGKKIFERYTSEIIVRENTGLDVWAYKTAMATLGWKELETYDEVILLNSTFMGTVYPF